MIKEFENGILTANGAALGKLKNVSLNDKLYSCDIENLNLSQVPDLEALLKSYNSAFLDISLMLLDPIQNEIISKYELQLNNEYTICYIHLTEVSHMSFEVSNVPQKSKKPLK